MSNNHPKIVSLSTGSIRFGCEDRNSLVDFAEDNFKGLIDGIELCFIPKEDFAKFELSKKQSGFLKTLKFNTLHAPVKNIEYGKNKETSAALQKIHEIGEKANLKYVTFHPNHVNDFSVLAESGLNICIENLPDGEKRKGWQFPQEFQKFFSKWPQFGFCFDINHAMANGAEPKDFISLLGEKIRYLHLNATAKPGNADHALLVESDQETIEKIRPVFALNKPQVIEVKLEKEKIPLIKEEIALVKKLAGEGDSVE
jgi:hypothetical protein